MKAHQHVMHLAYKFIPWGIIFIVSVLLASHPLIGMFDGVINWGAVQLFLQGRDPYAFEELSAQLHDIMPMVPGFQRVGGAPWAVMFTVPLYMWPFPLAKFLLAFVSLSLYYICVLRLKRIWPPLPRYSSALVWGYIPLLVCLYFGQLSIFPLFGVLLALDWLQSPRREWWKWAIACALFSLKPQGFIVLAPFLVSEFIRTSDWRSRVYACAFFGLLGIASLPMLIYAREWIASHEFSYLHRSATLSVYVRDLASWAGVESNLTLWALPVVSIVALFVSGVRIHDGMSFMFLLLLSQLTAPYIWVYDSCALMPLLYAMIGAFVEMNRFRWRRYLGMLFASVSLFPLYLRINTDFEFMRMHNVALAVAAILFLPGLRSYLPKGSR